MSAFSSAKEPRAGVVYRGRDGHLRRVDTTLRNVVNAPVPEITVQANFEAINDAWSLR